MILPRRLWKPHLPWVMTDWLRLMEPARGESCHFGQRGGPAAKGEDKLMSPGQNAF